MTSELFSPLGQAVLPGSIEERVRLYEKRMRLEEKGVEYRIVRERFLNSRILRAHVKAEGKVIPSFFFPGGKLPRKKEKAHVDFVHEGIAYLNQKAGTTYPSVKALIQSPPEYDALLKIKSALVADPSGYAPLIVLDRVEAERFEIFLESVFYEDTREFLVTFG